MSLSVSATTTVAAVIGSPIRHSLSPTLHNAAFAATGLDWVYAAFDVDAASAAGALEAMRQLKLGGLSVTMPCKDAVASLVDDLSPDARALHAVNCVRWDGDRLVGENFDGQGFVSALQDRGIGVTGTRCVIIGAGGAARSVGVALARSGVGGVVVVNRSAERATAAAKTIGDVASIGTVDAVAEADIVVDSTPLGMSPGDPLPFDLDLLRPGQIVADLVYHPARTPLLAEAERRGCVTINGLGMLLHQAALAFTAWTGTPAPIGAMRRAIAADV